MRLTIIILLIIIIAQSAYILYDFERDSSAISERGKREHILSDSLQALHGTIDLTRDSLTIAFETIRQANYARQEAEERAILFKARYEKQRSAIVHYNDAELDSVLLTVR